MPYCVRRGIATNRHSVRQMPYFCAIGAWHCGRIIGKQGVIRILPDDSFFTIYRVLDRLD